MIAGLADDDKVFGVDLVTGARKSQKFGSFTQAGRLRERLFTLQRLPPRLRARSLGRHRYCQFFAALGAAPFDDVAPARSRHAREKAMGALSADVARLIGSFTHKDYFPFRPPSQPSHYINHTVPAKSILPGLGFERPLHQIAHRIGWSLGAVEHLVHLLDDRHFH